MKLTKEEVIKELFKYLGKGKSLKLKHNGKDIIIKRGYIVIFKEEKINYIGMKKSEVEKIFKDMSLPYLESTEII